MPIYEAAGSLILHFGYGDIAVTHGRNIEKRHEDELCFVRQEPHPIGEQSTELTGQATDTVDCPVRFIFDKVESLDAVMEELKILRGKIVAAVDAGAEKKMRKVDIFSADIQPADANAQRGAYRATITVGGSYVDFEGEYELSETALVRETVEAMLRGKVQVSIALQPAAVDAGAEGKEC